MSTTSLWQQAPGWRWLVLCALVSTMLAWFGMRAGQKPLPAVTTQPRFTSATSTPPATQAMGIGTLSPGGSIQITITGPGAAASGAAANAMPDAFSNGTLLASSRADPQTTTAAPARSLSPQRQAFSSVVWESSMQRYGASSGISGGGLVVGHGGPGGTSYFHASRGVSSGRHYYELMLTTVAGEATAGTWSAAGVAVSGGTPDMGQLATLIAGPGRGAMLVRANNGYRTGDIFMIAIDAVNRVAYWGHNGQWMNGVPGERGGQPLTVSPGQMIFPYVGAMSASRNNPDSDKWTANFGSSPFRYAMPPGFNSYGSSEANGSTDTSVNPSTAMATASPSAAVAASVPKDALMGRSFIDRIVVGGEAIPLPSGTWITLAHFRARPGSVDGDAVILGRIEDKRLSGMVAINAFSHAVPSAASGFDAFPNCERDDYLVRNRDRNEARGEQRCWWVNHATGIWTGQAAFRAAFAELGQRGISPPLVMLNVGFRRATTQGFATAFYYFDPERERIRSMSTTWADSEWHKSRVASDPERVRYVQQLERWGESWAPIYYASK
jgi:hypothetical protein